MTAWTHLRGPGPTQRVVFIVLLLPFLGSTAPLSSEETTEIEYYPVADATGCYYNFQHYDEGDRIITNEPCLNCTCHNKMLMCYLKVCPFIKAIGQDCIVEKRPDQCCPVITCPEVHVHLLTSTTTPSSTAVGHPDAYGCTIDSLFYSDGARVPSSPNKPCELCYCIRNKTACVMQECTLNIDGCQPVYQDGVCCPVRYDCEHPKWEQIETTTTEKPTTERTTTPALIFTTLLPGGARDCIYEGEVYADGALVKKDVPCEHCYCMKGDIVCAVQECGPTPLDKVNCTALPTGEGKCCPDTYECNGMIEELTTEMLQEFTTLAPITKEPVTTEESTDNVVHLEDRIKDDESPEQSTNIAIETTTKLYPAPTSTKEFDHQTNESREPIQTSSEAIPSSSESDTTLPTSTTERKISSPDIVTEQYTAEPTEAVTEGKDIDARSTTEKPSSSAVPGIYTTSEDTTVVPIDVVTTQTSASADKTDLPTTSKPEKPTDHPLPEISQTTQPPSQDVYQDTKENEEPEQSTEYLPEVEKEKEPKFETQPTEQPEKAMKAEDQPAVTPEIVTSMPVDSKVPAIAEDQVTEEVPLATTIFSEQKPEISEEVPSVSTTFPEQKPENVLTTTQASPSVTENISETSSATVAKEGEKDPSVTEVPASDKEQEKTTTRPESVTTVLSSVTSEQPQPHDDGFDEHPAFDENEIDSHEDHDFVEPEITAPSEVEATTPRKISSEDEKITNRPEITTYQSVESQEITHSPISKSESTTESVSTTPNPSEKETPKPEVIENEIPSHDENEIEDNAIEQSTASEPEPTKPSETELIKPTEPGESIHIVPVTELSTEAHVSEGAIESSTHLPEQYTEQEPEEHSVYDESTKEHETTAGTTVSEPIVTVTPSYPGGKDATTKSEEPTVATEKYSPDADITESSQPLTTSSNDDEIVHSTSALPSQSTATPVDDNKQEQASEGENQTEEHFVDQTTVNPVKAPEAQTDLPVVFTTVSEIEKTTQEGKTTEKSSISTGTPIEKAEQTTESLFVTTVPIIVQETTLATRESDSAEEGIGKDTEAATLSSTEIPHTTYDYDTTEEERVIPGEGNCLVDGQTYKNNSSVPPINHCQVSCKCVSSILICESVSCSPPPTNLQNCMPVYQGPNSCCPTYSCSIPANTSMESDSHKIETTQRPEQTTLLVSETKEPEEVTEIISNVPTTVQPSSEFTTEKKGIPGESAYETTLSPDVFPLETSSHVPQESAEQGTTSQPFTVQAEGEKRKDDTAQSGATTAPELPIITTEQPAQTIEEQTTHAPVASQTEIPAGSSTEKLPEETPAITEKEQPTSSESSVIHSSTEDASATEKSQETTTIKIQTPESVTNEISQSVTKETVVTERITEKHQTPPASESYDQNTGFTGSSETEKLPTESTQKPSFEVETTTREVVATVTPSEICKDGEPCDTATDLEPVVTEAVYTVTSQAVTEKVESVKPSEPDSSEPEQTTATEAYNEIPTTKLEISERPACSEGEDCSVIQHPTTSLPLDDNNENRIPELPSEAPKEQCENEADCKLSPSPPLTDKSDCSDGNECKLPESIDHSTELPALPGCSGENCKIPQTTLPAAHETQAPVTEPTVIKGCVDGTNCELTPEKAETPAPEPYKPSEGESATSPPVVATEIITPETADHTETVYPKGTDKPALEPEVPLHDGCEEGEECDTGDEITEKPKPVTEIIVTERINEVCNDKECSSSNVGESQVTEHPVKHEGSSESPKETCQGEECGVIKPEEQPQTSKPEEEHGGDIKPAVPSDELSKATAAPEAETTEKVTSPPEISTTHISVETETPKHDQCSGDSCELPQHITEATSPEKIEPEIQTTAVPLNKDVPSEPAESSTTQIPQTTSTQAIETSSLSVSEEKITEQVPVTTEEPERVTELVTSKGQDVVTEYPVSSTERTDDKVTEPEITTSIFTEPAINEEKGAEEGSGETDTERISESVTTQEPASNNLTPEPVEPEASLPQDTSPQPASSTAQPETPVEPEVFTPQDTSPQPASSTAQPETTVKPEVSSPLETSPQPSSSTVQPESTDKNIETTTLYISHTTKLPAEATTSDADGQVFTSRPVEDDFNKEIDVTTSSVIIDNVESQEKVTTSKSENSDTTTRIPFEPVTLSERKDEPKPKPTEAYTDVPITERLDEETQVPEENPETVTPFKLSTEKTETVTPIQEKTEPSQQPSTTTPSATTTLISRTESPTTSQESLTTTIANEPVNASQSEISPEARPEINEELFTSGPFEEPTTKKSVLGELSTSASFSATFSEPITTTTTSLPSHDIPESQGPELPDYQSPIDDYEEEDQNSFGPGTCRYGGKVYVSAQQIPRDDPCDFCFCFRSDIICLQQSCPPPIPNCHEEPIRGFCCPRYECPVSMATSLNITTTSTTTTTTLPPHFLSHAYKGRAAKAGCQVRGRAFKVGDEIKSESGPCLHCTCGGDGQMQCDPKPCSPEPMLKQMISAASKARRR